MFFWAGHQITLPFGLVTKDSNDFDSSFFGGFAGFDPMVMALDNPWEGEDAYFNRLSKLKIVAT